MSSFTLRGLLPAALCLISTTLFGQVTFQKAFSDADARWAEAIDVVPASGGYIVAGNVSTFDFDYKPFLMKISEDGSLIWHKYYAIGEEETYFNKVIAANDGGFLAVGTARDFNGEILLVKTDTEGTLQWQKIIPSYTTNRRNGGRWIYPVADGYIISGGSHKNDDHAVLVKIDNQGQTIWSKRYSFYWGDNPVINAAFVSGDTIFATGSKDSVALFSRFDANGNPLSALMLKGTGDHWKPLSYMAPAPNGDLLLAGNTVVPDTSVPSGQANGQWVCRISRTGELRWSKTYSNVGHGRISPLSDGNFLLSPFYQHYQLSLDLNPTLVKISGDGEVLWSYQYGLKSLDAFQAAIETPDGGILAVGAVRLPDNPLNQSSILVVRTDANGLIAECCTQPISTMAVPYPVELSAATMNQTTFDNAINYGAPGEDGSLSTLDYCPPLSRNVEVSLCPGDSIVIDGISYTGAGQVSSTVPGPKCDTNFVYNIKTNINPTFEKTIVFCPGDTVFLHGNTYTQPVAFTQAIPSATGHCDTLVNYTLEYELLDPNSVLQLNCPADITVPAAAGNGPVAIHYNEPSASSDCLCPDVALVRTSGGVSGSNFPAGLNTVCYRAEDACGQVKTCCFTISVEAEETACDVKNNGCIRFELLQVNRDAAQNWVYYVRVTNNCADAVNYVYLQVPDGLQAVGPANNDVYTTLDGNAYTVRNPNFSPFYSVRYKAGTSNLSGGQSDVFRYVLPAQADVDFIHVAVRLASGTLVGTHLNTFSCPIGTEPSSKAEAGERSISETSGPLILYPNPLSSDQLLTLRGAHVEGSTFLLEDLTGRVLLETAISDNQIFLGNAGLPTGIYFFKILKNSQSIGSGKIAVMK